jgi:hypothetical protein
MHRFKERSINNLSNSAAIKYARGLIYVHAFEFVIKNSKYLSPS